jgi:glutathione S-transferase
MVTLYEFPVSPFCDKVRRVLHVKRVAYRTEKVPLLATLGWYRHVNPAAKVPTLVHDGTTIADSTAIAHYLETTFDGPTLLPSDPAERALCNVLEDWADESLYFYQKRLKFTVQENARHWTQRFSVFDSWIGRALLSVFLVGRQERQLHAQGLGRKSLAAILDDIGRLVASVDALAERGEWLVGSALTLADIAVCAQLTSLAATPEGQGILERHPTTLAWMARVDAVTA